MPPADIQVDMSRSTILKEAIKTGLAFAAVFGIAMQLGWMNPTGRAAVAAIGAAHRR